MPLVKVLTKSFINNAIREEGEVIEYDGKIGSNLELVDGKQKKKAKPEQEQTEVFEPAQEQPGE
jgi:hypothetical protein